jgi:hypothetical protein
MKLKNYSLKNVMVKYHVMLLYKFDILLILVKLIYVNFQNNFLIYISFIKIELNYLSILCAFDLNNFNNL